MYPLQTSQIRLALLDFVRNITIDTGGKDISPVLYVGSCSHNTHESNINILMLAYNDKWAQMYCMHTFLHHLHEGIDARAHGHNWGVKESLLIIIGAYSSYSLCSTKQAPKLGLALQMHTLTVQSGDAGDISFSSLPLPPCFCVHASPEAGETA